jgi:hypothetical protein
MLPRSASGFRFFMRGVVSLAALATVLAATAAAQTSTGGLRGFVKDDTGGVLAGVTVDA